MPPGERRITPVILSGGSGTRLWPLSRAERPKQLLALAEAETMLQATARRIADPARFAPPLVVANARHATAIIDQLGAIGIDDALLVLEPHTRNTAPAIALAAVLAAESDPETQLLVMPSDHVVGKLAAFHDAIAAAGPAVAGGWLVTFGIAPDAPETGYGYIRRGAALMRGVERAEAFVEKPDRATATEYLESGRYAWNGGIFLFRADAYLSALERFHPEILAAARAAMAAATRTGRTLAADADAFAAAPSLSIDYAVMERSDRIAVVPVDMGWSDVGSWDALSALSPCDPAGNRLAGDVVAIGTERCFVRSDGPLVAAIGVSDLTVIASDDAVLVMPRGASQDVKLAIEALKARDHGTLDRAPRLSHGWGEERRLCRGEALEVTLVEVAPGARSGWLAHAGPSRLERVSGRGRAEPGGPIERILEIPAGAVVTLVNEGDRPLIVLRIAQPV